MIRILHVVRPVNGGMASHLQSLLSGLNTEMFEHALACPTEQTPSQILQHAKDVFELSIQDGITPFTDLQAVQQLLYLLQTQPFDILHLHGFKALVIGSIAVGKLKSIPPFHKPKVICTIHNFLSKKQQLFWRILLSSQVMKLSQIDLFVTVSDKLRAHFESICKIEAKGSTFLTVHNGIQQDRPYIDKRIARRVFQVERESFVVGSIARLNPDKGVDVLIRAMALVQRHVPTICLVIIGDGPEKRNLMKLADKLGVTNIHWLGQMPQADQFMKGFDLFVQPSRREGFGITAIEAMCANIPVVASRVGGLSEIIEQNVSGMLVKPDDPMELAEAILYLHRYPFISELYAKAGRARMQQFYNNRVMLEQWTSIYEQSLQQISPLELSDVEMAPTHS